MHETMNLRDAKSRFDVTAIPCFIKAHQISAAFQTLHPRHQYSEDISTDGANVDFLLYSCIWIVIQDLKNLLEINGMHEASFRSKSKIVLKYTSLLLCAS